MLLAEEDVRRGNVELAKKTLRDVVAVGARLPSDMRRQAVVTLINLYLLDGYVGTVRKLIDTEVGTGLPGSWGADVGGWWGGGGR